jgi:hypothetical protein
VIRLLDTYRAVGLFGDPVVLARAPADSEEVRS